MSETEEKYEPVTQDALEMARAALEAYSVLKDLIPMDVAAGMAERFALTAFQNLNADIPGPVSAMMIKEMVDEAVSLRLGSSEANN